MRKTLALAAALMLPAVPLLIAVPAHAAVAVICVGSPAGPCGTTKASISAAISAASGVDATILVGPGTYSDGPYSLQPGVHSLTLQGSGDATKLTLPASGSQTYVSAAGATVRDLKIVMNATTPDNDTGLSAFDGATVTNVTVDGTGVANSLGMHVRSSLISGATIQVTGDSSAAMYGEGSATITDSTLTGADRGFYHSATGPPDVLSRVTIHAGAGGGVLTDVGTVNVEDSVIDLGTTGGAGLAAVNFNNGAGLKSINADHVTIVGGGPNSRGAWAYAAAPGAKQLTTLTLSNSIVRGPATSLVADATNNGAQGGPSSATLTVSHTDYQTKGGTIGTSGSGGVVLGAGNVTDVDPLFVNAASGNYRLGAGSPAIDAGDPAVGTPSTDRDGNPRVQDGNANGVAIRDLGAYEYADTVAPQTTVTGGPAAITRDTTPTVAFASEAGATFACQVDAVAYTACTSPFTTSALANGKHTIRVRASDNVGNTDASPATRTFTVDTKAPSTTLTKKPAKTVTSTKVTFKFAATEAGSTFQCRLDTGAWKSCRSPRSVAIAKGTHVFRVRAIDRAGNVDATPAAYAFKRK